MSSLDPVVEMQPSSSSLLPYNRLALLALNGKLPPLPGAVAKQTGAVQLTISVGEAGAPKGQKISLDISRMVNGAATKVRGFCDHSNFGGVGGAVPDRVNLFRAQLLRSVGGNAWRMAHNPPVPSRLDIMDRLGMLAMDENRDYGGILQQGGLSSETLKEQIQDMGDLVQRDRSHPSVMLWSFCVSQTLIDSDRPAWSLSRHAPKQRI